MNRIETTLKALIFALSLTALGGLIGCDAGPEAGASGRRDDLGRVDQRWHRVGRLHVRRRRQHVHLHRG